MRNPSHQLNTERGAKDMPNRSSEVFGRKFWRDVFADQMSYSAKCMVIPGEMALSAPVDLAGKMRSMLRNMARPDAPGGSELSDCCF
jgi:hypothetical protein